MRFERVGDGAARTTILLDAKYQGYSGIAHGGMVMMLLDEAMAHATGMLGEKGMTASIAVRFRKPVPTGVELTLHGEVKWQRRRVLSVEGTITDPSGEVLATSEGSFVTAGKLDKPFGANTDFGRAASVS